MFRIIKRYPMLTSAVLGCFMVIIFYYYERLSLIMGIALIIMLYVMYSFKVPFSQCFSVFCTIIICCSMLLRMDNIHTLSNLNGEEVTGSFVVTEKLQNLGDGMYGATVKTKDTDKLTDGSKLFAYFYEDECPNLDTGDIIEGKFKLRFSTGKYRLNDFSQNIYFRGYFKEYSLLEAMGDTLYSFIGTVPNYITDFLFKNLSYSEASTLTALTIGDRSYMSDEFYGCVKAAGVSHVMVVSGMHLAIIMSFVTKTIEKFFYNRKLKALIIFLTVGFMAAVCGFTPSITRAGVTYIFMGISYLLNRPNTPSNTLGTAVTLILIFSPMTVFNLAFQLSALSTYGVLVLSPALSGAFKRYFKIKFRFISYITDAISVTLCAMVTTLPVTIYRFGYISVVGVLTNLLISYAVTVALVCAVIALIISLIYGTFSKPFLLASGVVTKYINSTIFFLGKMPFATADIPTNYYFLGILLIALSLILLYACKYLSNVLKLNRIKHKVLSETEGKFKWR